MPKTLKSLPRLEQIELASLAASGDRRAAASLVAASRGFILTRVRRYAKAYLADDSALEADLVAEGELGMFEALLRYDATRSLHPLTYCAHWIDLRIRNALSKASGPASVGSPQHWREAGSPRTYAESVDVIAETVENPAQNALEQLIFGENSRILSEKLAFALTQLDSTDRRIIKLRFLRDKEPRLTLAEVGLRVKLSRERTRQREIAALKQLLTLLDVPSDRLTDVRRLR